MWHRPLYIHIHFTHLHVGNMDVFYVSTLLWTQLLLSHQVDCMCLRDSVLLRFFWQLYRRKFWQQHLDAHAGQILTVCPLALTQSKPKKLSKELHNPPCIQT